jgi:aldose 1-epimerase
MIRLFIVFIAILWSGSSVTQDPNERLEEAMFGQMPDSTVVKQFVLRNTSGMQVTIISYGAIVTQIQAPDREGNLINVVAGRGTLEPYLNRFPAAAVIGRVVNRIGNAQFSIDGVKYHLTVNDRGKHHIHGGRGSFARVVWEAEALPVTSNGAGVRLTHRSADGEDGYPGNVTATVTYTLTDDNDLRLDYTATTDRPTVINMSNHAYFNLAGSDDLQTHELVLNADRYTPTDNELIPTGEIRSVENTPMDFTTPEFIGARTDRIQAPITNAYDHNFIINGRVGEVRLAARVHEVTSGRMMEVFTDRPGVQLYTANPAFFCLETQDYPDAINHPNFPSPIVRPGTPFETTTIFRFSTE